MPSSEPTLTLETAAEAAASCFAPCHEGKIGVEIEWLAVQRGNVSIHPDFTLLSGIVKGIGELAGGSRVGFEPGGQVELASPPVRGIGNAIDAIASDIDLLEAALAHDGIHLVGLGLDATRPGRRVLEVPRYTAMEAYFESEGGSGREMMLTTASIQVNLDNGAERDVGERWRTANALGPTLAAAFANSPKPSTLRGRWWRSYRLAIWSSIDPTRTATPDVASEPADAWLEYALDANVMLIRTSESDYRPRTASLTFRDWMARGSQYGYPTLEDFEYHLTTLFPPVRPRGSLELRMIDALPSPWWRVPVAVAAALIEEPVARARAAAACSGTETLWAEAAEFGLADPRLARSARDCFDAALEALSRLPGDRRTVAAVAEYRDRYVSRARSPADDHFSGYREWVAAGAVSA